MQFEKTVKQTLYVIQSVRSFWMTCYKRHLPPREIGINFTPRLVETSLELSKLGVTLWRSREPAKFVDLFLELCDWLLEVLRFTVHGL